MQDINIMEARDGFLEEAYEYLKCGNIQDYSKRMKGFHLPFHTKDVKLIGVNFLQKDSWNVNPEEKQKSLSPKKALKKQIQPPTMELESRIEREQIMRESIQKVQ